MAFYTFTAARTQHACLSIQLSSTENGPLLIPHTLIDMRTDLTAVPHARLRHPNPERTRKVLKILEVFKRTCGPKVKAKSIRQSDGVPCVTAAALALYQRLKIVQVQVVDQTTHPPKCHSFVGLDRQIGSCSLQKKTIQKNPCDYKGQTHTHTHTLCLLVEVFTAPPCRLLSLQLSACMSPGQEPYTAHNWASCCPLERYHGHLTMQERALEPLRHHQGPYRGAFWTARSPRGRE